MSQNQENLIVALDIGSSQTRVLAAELHEKSLRYRGHGVVDSAGIRRGMISDLAPAIKAARAASELAEQSARNLNITECVLAIGGPHVRGLNAKGGFDLGSRMREITRDDMRNAVERARNVERPAEQEIVHVLQRQFVLDEQPGIYNPVGMVGSRLEVELHIATCSGSALQSSVTCANRAGMKVTEAVLESIAAAECTLSADERELGICLLNIGAHTSELAVFYEGMAVHTASIPIGGAHFTNDLAAVLKIPIASAEEIKRQYGHTVVTAVPQNAEAEILVPEPRMVPLRLMAEILESRARELMRYVRDNLRDAAVLDALGVGCVLTGGGALLPGMLDIVESYLHVPARLGTPTWFSHLPSELQHPAFAVSIGTLLYVERTRKKRAAEAPSFGSKLRTIFMSNF